MKRLITLLSSAIFIAMGFQAGAATVSGLIYEYTTPAGPSAPTWLAPGNISSTGAGGNWNSASTWTGGVVPGQYDDVLIADGAIVIIDAAAQCWDLTVGQGTSGILRYGTAASSLTVWHNASIAAGGTFEAGAAAGPDLTHHLYIGGNSATYDGGGGNLTVNGTFDMHLGSANGKTSVTFFGNSNASLSGTPSVIDLNSTNTLNKGTITATSTITPPILDIQCAFTVAGSGTSGFLSTLTAGVIKISGNFTQSNTIFTLASYSIPALGGVWLDNPNFIVSGLSGGSPTTTGLFRISNGIYTVGTSSVYSMGGGTGAVFIFEGGSLNIGGRFFTSAASYFNLSGTNITVATYGNAVSSPSFGLTNPSNTIIISGGSVVLQQASTGSTPFDYNVAGNSIQITGGTLQVGNSATTTNFLFRLAGAIPNLIIDNTTNNKNANLYAAATVYRDITVNTGTSLNLNGFSLTAMGAVNNNGTISANVTGSGLVMQGSAAQTISGTISSNSIYNLTINNNSGVSIIPAFTVLNSLTLTDGALSTAGAGITLGNAGTNSFAYICTNGSISSAITRNYGSGTNNFTYNGTGGAQTTGNELPSVVTTGTLTISNAAGLTLASALIIQNLTLTSGVLTTNTTHTITVSNSNTGAVTQTNGYVNGPLDLTLPALLVAGSTYVFPVGKGSYNPIELVNPTTGAGGTCVIRAEVFDASCGGTAGTGFSTINADRYWQASFTSGSANFASTQLRLTDASITASNKIGVNPTPGLVNGTYNGVVSALSGTSLLTSGSSLTASDLNFFVIGTKSGLSAGTYYVGGGGAPYANLTAVAQMLKDNVVIGNTIFELQADYPASPETFPVVFEQFGTSGGSWTVTIRPKSDVASMLYTSGDPGAANPLVNLNGADNLTFDGRPGGTGSIIKWTLRNTRAVPAYGPVVQLINDANANTLAYLSVESQNQGVSSGTVVFGTTTETSGNDNNTITNCEIRDRADLTWASTTLPYNALYASGSTGSAVLNNSGNNILNNRICNYYYNNGAAQGLNIGAGNNTWTISGNSFYVTGDLTAASGGSAYWYGIFIANASTGDGFAISGNYIGGMAPACGGSALSFGPVSLNTRFLGMYLSVGSTAASSVQGNTIANISLATKNSTTTAPSNFGGIHLAGGHANIGDVTGNTIGSGTGTGNIIVTSDYASSATSTYGIFCNAASSSVNISNNVIGSVTVNGTGPAVSQGFYGIYVSAGTNIAIGGNSIGSGTTAGSINAANTSLASAAQSVFGIYSSAPATTSIANNTIANLNNNYAFTSATSGTLTGLYVSNSSLPIIISGNTIRNLTTTSPSSGSITLSSLLGMYVSTSTNITTISSNLVHSLSNSFSGTNIQNAYGIYFSGGAATHVIEMNFVHSISLASTGTNTTSGIYGIVAAGGTSTYKNNMVRLGIGKDGNNLTTGHLTIGILKSTTANNNFYFNSVVIGGTGVTAVQRSACFERSGTGTDDVRDNIFTNLRSNTVTGSTKNFSLYLNNTSALTSNYNVIYGNGIDYIAAGVGASNYTTLTAWKATGFDGNSKNQNPQLMVPVGNAATVDLHINTSIPTSVEANGILIAGVTNDFDNQARADWTPVDIGADAGNFTAISGTSLVSVPDVLIVPANIPSTVTSIGSAIPVFNFKITDVGGDSKSTLVTTIKFKNTDPANGASWNANIQGVVLNDGINDITISSISITATEITLGILSGNLTIADNSVKGLTLKIYLKTSGIQDGKKLQFYISQLNHGWDSNPAGSLFSSYFGADITSSEHTIVVTATKLLFSIVPSSVFINANFNATVSATDANGNTDADNSSSVTLSRNSGTGTLSSATGLTQSLVNGTKAWTDLKYNKYEIFKMQAAGGSLTQAVSGNISCTNELTLGNGTADPVFGPFYNFFENNRTQMLFLQPEIGGAFEINSIAFDISQVSPVGYRNFENFTIKIKHTATAAFGPAYENMTSATTVFTGTPYSMPSVTGWLTFPISNFNYNGADNLLLEITWGDNGEWNNTYFKVNGTDYGASNYYMVYGYANAETPPSCSGITTIRPNIRLVAAVEMSYISSTVTQANTASLSPGEVNGQLIGIEVVTAGTLSPISISKFKLNTNGTTLPADIAKARLYYTGTSNSFGTSTQFGSEINNPSGTFYITGAQTLSVGTNYFWLAYDIAAGAADGNVVDAACDSVVIASIFYAPDVTAPSGSRAIQGPLNGTKTVGSGGNFITLTGTGGLFETINIKGLKGNLVAEIISDMSEPGTVELNQWAETGAGNYTLTIRPDAAVLKTISGNYAGALVRINGADRVSVDGSFNGSGQYLAFTNLCTVLNSNEAFSLLNNANNNAIRNCMIYSKHRAITLTSADNTSIEGNDIYGDVAGNANYSQAGIYLGTNSLNTQIERNSIHDFYYNGSGEWGVAAIWFETGSSSSVTQVINNLIYNIKADGNIASTSSSNPNGIYLGSGGNIKIYYNSVYLSGNVLSATTTTWPACIAIASGVSLLDIRNNILQNSLQLVSGAQPSKTYAVATAGTNAQFVQIDYNDYYVNGIGPNIGRLGADCSSLASWQAATGQDAGSASADPIYVTSTDLQLQSASPAKGKAGVLSAVTDDYTGATRHPFKPAMGAYDYTPPGFFMWTGSVSTSWSAAGNWSPAGIPSINDDAGIPTTPSGNPANFPLVPVSGGPYHVNELFLGPGAAVIIHENAQLIINNPIP